MKHASWIVLIFLFWVAGAISANETTVSLQTEPPAQAIQPDRDLVKTTIFLPPNTDYEITIRTPPSHEWFSTDFPVVEDTELYRFQGTTPTGEVGFETIYPIRGKYPIEVTANGKKHALVLHVNEAPSEMRNVAIFLGALFLLGLVGGQIFLRSLRAQSALALILLVGGFSFMMPKPLFAHGNKEAKAAGAILWEQKQGDFSMHVRFDASHAVVGENVAFDIEVQKAGNVLAEPVTVGIETFHMEDETVMFKGKFTAPTGTMKQTLHFFDGAQTQTTFTVEPAPGVFLSAGGVIDVTGVSPPLGVQVKTMILLAVVTFGGMAVGFFLIPGNKIAGEAV